MQITIIKKKKNFPEKIKRFETANRIHLIPGVVSPEDQYRGIF